MGVGYATSPAFRARPAAPSVSGHDHAARAKRRPPTQGLCPEAHAEDGCRAARRGSGPIRVARSPGDVGGSLGEGRGHASNRPLIDALARHHQVLAADNRGAGSSDKPDVPYSYGMMAADTLAAMDAAGVGAADIVGFSMGARIAIELCLARSERGADSDAHRRQSRARPPHPRRRDLPDARRPSRCPARPGGDVRRVH
ncbi:MAG: alpha/beta fold hydrolase [Solirubrobacteraceae bacterium]